jgi:hypothetical protein
MKKPCQRCILVPESQDFFYPEVHFEGRMREMRLCPGCFEEWQRYLGQWFLLFKQKIDPAWDLTSKFRWTPPKSQKEPTKC